MATAAKETRRIRKELAESGACPFEVAAAALEQVERYRQIIAELEAQLRR
jgi:hypothetical protein